MSGLVRALLLGLVVLVGSPAGATMLWNQGGGGGGSGDITDVGDCTGPACFNGTSGNSLQFEGSTADGFETNFTAIDPTADRTISLPNMSGTVAMERVYDVRAYGALCNDSTNDAAAIQAAIDAAEATGQGGVVEFPAGICVINSGLTINEPGITLRGQGAATGNNATVLQCNFTTGTCVEMQSACVGCGVEQMIVASRNVPTTLKLIDGTGTNLTFVRNVNMIMERYCVGIEDVVIIEDVRLLTPVAGATCRGVSLTNMVQVFLTRVNGNLSTNIDGMIVIEQTGVPGTVPDSFNLTDVVIAQNLGSGAALKIQADDTANPPRWIQVTNSQFEAKTTDASTGDYPIYLKNVRDFKCSSCYAHGGYNAVRIEGGPGPITFAASVIGNSQREAIYHDADVITTLVGTTVSDASQVTDNMYSDVYLSANSRGFSMIGGTVGSELLGFVSNDPKYGIEVAAGADEYRFSNVTCTDIPDTSCAFGLTPAAAQGAFTDATAYADSDWTNYVTVRAPSLSANWTLTLPTTDGNAGEFLQTDGSGGTTWAAASGSGDITAVGNCTSGACFDGTSGTTLTSAGDSAFILFSGGNVFVEVDTDNDDAATGFVIRNSADDSLFEVNENNNVIVYNNIPLRLREAAVNGTHSIGVQGPAALSADWTLTLPANDGDANQFLQTNGSGTTSWVEVALGSMTSGSYAAGTAEAGRATSIDALSCTNGVVTDASGMPACAGAPTQPEFTGRSMVAGGALAAYAVVVPNGANDDEVIEATTTATSITGCAQNAGALIATNPVVVATAGIARCKTTGTVTAGTLVKIGATGAVTNAASTDSLIFGRAVTDAASGTAYIMIDATDGFDRAIDVFPAYPDSTTATALSVSPTFSMGSSATQTMFGMTPTITAGAGSLAFVRIQPAMTFSVGTTLPVIDGIQFGGTLTTSAATDEFPTFKMFSAALTAEATTAGREPISSFDVLSHTNTYRYAVNSGAGSGGTVTGINDIPVFSASVSGGSWTSGDVYTVRSRLTVNETSGATLVVPNRYGFSFSDFTRTGTGSGEVTNQVAVDIGALSNALTTNIGLRNADTTVFTPAGAQSISSTSSTLTPSATVLQVTATGAIGTLISNPQISDGQDGQIITIVYSQAANSFTFADGNGLQLSSTMLMDQGNTLTLMYNSALADWVEVARALN